MEYMLTKRNKETDS